MRASCLALSVNAVQAHPSPPERLLGRLRRAQTSLRTLGIEIAFSREGRDLQRFQVVNGGAA
jgi:hypothetical protein